MEHSIFDTEHIKKTYFKLALPVVLGLVITLIYNLADTYFIARTNLKPLVAGVSICSPLFTALMGFGNIFGQGGSSLISRLLGQNEKKSIEKVSAFCFYVALLVGILLASVMLLFQESFLYMIGATEETYQYAKDYYQILVAGAPIIVVSFIHSNLTRCEGMANQSMIGNTLGAVVNIILDPILISVCGWGAKGAATATVIGYFAADIYFIILVLRKSQFLSLDIRECIIDLSSIGQIFGVGVTAAITNLMQSLSLVIMNQFLIPYGNDKVAAMGIVLKVIMIPQLILTGFAFGGVPFVGYLYGARLHDKLKELIRFCLKFMGGLSLGISLVMFVLAPNIIRGFMKDDGIVSDGAFMLRAQIVSTVFVAIVLFMTVIFQAIGKVIPAFIMSISRQGVVFLLVIVMMKWLLGYEGILVTPAIADVISACIAIFIYRKVMKQEKVES